jgi:hypothetical protein
MLALNLSLLIREYILMNVLKALASIFSVCNLHVILLSKITLASIGQPTDNAELAKRIEELSRRVEALSTERIRPSSRDHHYSLRDRPSRHGTATTACWYHRRFGDQARNCSPPCTYSQQEN